MIDFKRLFGKIIDIVAVKKCVACGELLEYDCKDKLCAECKADWEIAKREVCPHCREAQVDCTCGFGRGSVDSVRHIGLYTNKEKDGVVNRIVYALKKSNSSDVFDFVANEMKNELLRGRHLDNTVLASVPRNPVAIRKHGYDHAKRLAKKLAELTGAEYVDVLGHRGGKTEQKMLNKVQRIYNAKKNCFFKEEGAELIKGKNVLLVDDIGTTGAMMGACAELLKKYGAKRVDCILAARNEKN